MQYAGWAGETGGKGPKPSKIRKPEKGERTDQGEVGEKGEKKKSGFGKALKIIKDDFKDLRTAESISVGQQLQDLERMYENLQQQLIEVTEERDSLAKQARDSEADLRRMQEHQFDRVSDARYTPIEDAGIMRELSYFGSEIRKLGKDHAVKQQLDPQKIPAPYRDDLVRRLQDVFQGQELAKQSDRPVDLGSLLNKTSNAPRLLWTAMLSDEIHHGVLENPFFFLRGIVSDPTDKRGSETTSSSSIFWNVYIKESSRDLKEAALWRSQTVRFFDPPQDQITEPTGEARLQMNNLLRAAARKAADEFLGASPAYLLKPLDGLRHQEFHGAVRALFERAGRFSLKLAKERVHIECKRLEHVKGDAFAVDSALLEADLFHHLDTDGTEQDRSLNGNHIRLVVNPAVVCHGTHDLEDYGSSSRIWSKAVVCLEVEGGPI